MMRRFNQWTVTRGAGWAVGWVLLGWMSACAAGSVGQWGMVELSRKGPIQGNPFLEVRFGARFVQGATEYLHADQDGRSIELPGRPYQAIRIRRVQP